MEIYCLLCRVVVYSWNLCPWLIIKRISLTIAFANKAIAMFWGVLWGALFFQEKISVGKLIGIGIVIAGVVLYTSAEKEKYE